MIIYRMIKKYGNNAGIVSAEKTLFFCSSILLYSNIKKKQQLFTIFIAEIIYNFGSKMVTLHDGSIFYKIFLMF